MYNPHISLWPPSMWFGSKHASGVQWKPDMTPEEAAAVIERFLREAPDSVEWCDFAETPQRDPTVERYRKRCDKLSPLVNRPGELDEAAVAELKAIIEELRSTSNPETLEKNTGRGRQR
jgi:hypothetical protein